MVFVVIDDESRSSTSSLSLVGVGYDDMIGKVDDLAEGLVQTLPAFAHENAVNLLFFL